MLPPDKGSNPAMQLSAVDLPQPDGPSRQMNSPRFTVRLSSLSAANACPPAPAKRRVTPSSLSWVKSCFMNLSPSFEARRHKQNAALERRRRRRSNAASYPVAENRDGITSLRLLRADLLIPDAERL